MNGSARTESNGTVFTLRHRFAKRKQAPSYAAGWHLCLEGLTGLLDGKIMPSMVGHNAYNYGYNDLYAQYAQQLEIELRDGEFGSGMSTADLNFPLYEISLEGKYNLLYSKPVAILTKNGGSSMNAVTLSALAEPNRISIVELLRDYGALNLGEIAGRLGLRMPQSSKHLRVLTDAGLVEVQADANRRIFRLRQERFTELNLWLQTFQAAKEEQFERLDALLEKVQREEQQGNQ